MRRPQGAGSFFISRDRQDIPLTPEGTGVKTLTPQVAPPLSTLEEGTLNRRLGWVCSGTGDKDRLYQETDVLGQMDSPSVTLQQRETPRNRHRHRLKREKPPCGDPT